MHYWETGLYYLSTQKSFRDRLAAGRQALNLKTGVRIPVPELKKYGHHLMAVFFVHPGSKPPSWLATGIRSAQPYFCLSEGQGKNGERQAMRNFRQEIYL